MHETCMSRPGRGQEKDSIMHLEIVKDGEVSEDTIILLLGRLEYNSIERAPFSFREENKKLCTRR